MPLDVAATNAYARFPSLQDRGVLITGGATGIGATLVEEFVAQGARVGFIDIDKASGEALVARLHEAPYTVLLNNAANDQRHSIESTTSQSWDAGVAVNLKHQFFAAKNVAADMKAAGGGSIVNFGSVSWKLKQGGMPVYTTSKAAVQGLTRSLARDYGPFNIRVNTLVPGWVMTDKQIRLWLDEKGKQEIARGQCINKPLQPEDIARMALFLAADDSAMCTAQDFIVDGGWV